MKKRSVSFTPRAARRHAPVPFAVAASTPTMRRSPAACEPFTGVTEKVAVFGFETRLPFGSSTRC